MGILICFSFIILFFSLLSKILFCSEISLNNIISLLKLDVFKIGWKISPLFKNDKALFDLL